MMSLACVHWPPSQDWVKSPFRAHWSWPWDVFRTWRLAMAWCLHYMLQAIRHCRPGAGVEQQRHTSTDTGTQFPRGRHLWCGAGTDWPGHDDGLRDGVRSGEAGHCGDHRGGMGGKIAVHVTLHCTACVDWSTSAAVTSYGIYLNAGWSLISSRCLSRSGLFIAIVCCCLHFYWLCCLWPVLLPMFWLKIILSINALLYSILLGWLHVECSFWVEINLLSIVYCWS